MVAQKSLYHTGNELNIQFSRYFKYRGDKMSIDPEGNMFNIECQTTVYKTSEYVRGLPICVS